MVAREIKGAWQCPVGSLSRCERSSDADVVRGCVLFDVAGRGCCCHVCTSSPRRPSWPRAGDVLRDGAGQLDAGVVAEAHVAAAAHTIAHAAIKREGIGASVGNFPGAVGVGVCRVPLDDYRVARCVTVRRDSYSNRRGIGAAGDALCRLQRLRSPHSSLPQRCWRGAAHDADRVAGDGAHRRRTSGDVLPPPADVILTIN